MKKYGSHHKGNPACIKRGSSAAEEVAASSNDLADGANQSGHGCRGTTATVAGVSEQAEQNSKSAKEISGKVDELEVQFGKANGKMQGDGCIYA